MSSPSLSSSSSSSRFHDLRSSFPPVTLGIMALCCGVYLAQMIFPTSMELSHYTLCPRLVVFLHEYYRCITSTLFHGNLMHLGMNVMSTSAISAPLERKVGTLRHAFSMSWSIVATSVVYIMVALGASVLLGKDKLMYQHAVGFSGVLFHLSVLESNMSSGNRSVFGMFTVPSYMYPWVLLVVLQFMMPNISFVGHLAGILTGTLELYGVWDIFLIPTESFLMEMEQWRMLRPLVHYPTFCATPPLSSSSFINGGGMRDVTALRRTFCQGVCWIWKWVRDLLECLQYCLLGRGRQANANLYLLPRTTTATTTPSSSSSSSSLMNGRILPSATIASITSTATTTTTTPWSLDTDYLDDGDDVEQQHLLQQHQQQPSTTTIPPPPTQSKMV